MKPIKIIEKEMISKSRSESECRSLARVRKNMMRGKMDQQKLRSILLKMKYYEIEDGDWEKLIEKQP